MNLILLAEDNVVNCKVIQEQLRILGYASEVGKDGEEALQMWQSGRFSLLLTDCNMPLMNGFELAAAIRRQEQAGTRIPIVAVTANVSGSDVQRCLASGMDDYLSKPLRVNELERMLVKWLPEKTDVGTAVVAGLPRSTGTPPLVVWDVNILVNLLGDDTELRRSILADFQHTTSHAISAINAAIEAGNAKQAAAEAHKLKSASRTVGAMLLGEECQKMETAGRAGDIKACQKIAGGVQQSYADATAAIAQYLG